MAGKQGRHLELSVPLGFIFILLGSATVVMQFSVNLFTGWSPAVAYISLFMIVGVLLLFSDVRVYQFNRSPTEQLVVENGSEAGHSSIDSKLDR